MKRKRGSKILASVLLATVCLFASSAGQSVADIEPIFGPLQKCVDAAENSVRNDQILLDSLKQVNAQETIPIDCFSSLVLGNHFNSANYVVDTLEPDLIDQAIEVVKEASDKV